MELCEGSEMPLKARLFDMELGIRATKSSICCKIV